MDPLAELDALILRHCARSPQRSAIDRILLSRYDAPHEPVAALYYPLLCIVVSGRKRTASRTRSYTYGPGDHLVNALDRPMTGSVLEVPHTAVILQLDTTVLAELVDDRRPLPYPSDLSSGPSSPELLDAAARLLRLLDTPEDIPTLAPLAERELLYRALQGPCGDALRHVALRSGPVARVRPVIGWIRENLDRPLRIDALADLAGMSPASLHRHFKAATTLSPLQFQKALRLETARDLLLTGGQNAASAGHAVGYTSPSQFNREYRRHFGATPGALLLS